MSPESPPPAAAADGGGRAAAWGAAGGGVKTLASAAAMAEISRLTVALRVSEAERASAAAGEGSRGGVGGEVGVVARERDEAVAEVRERGEWGMSYFHFGGGWAEFSWHVRRCVCNTCVLT